MGNRLLLLDIPGGDTNRADPTPLYPVVSAGLLVSLSDTVVGTNRFAVSLGLLTVDDAGTLTARIGRRYGRMSHLEG